MQLVDLKPLIPNAIIDLRYTTTRNITGQALYGKSVKPQLDARAAKQLVKAAKWFHTRGLRLVVWDGYRPPEVQMKLLTANSDHRYVLDAEDSYHCRGQAIDITLAHADGTYLDMGTDHDDFTPLAHVDCHGLTPEQSINRQLLMNGMVGAGFAPWPYEWWHFNYLIRPVRRPKSLKQTTH